MAHACQTMICDCVATDAPLLRSAKVAPVQWKDNGDAYCAAGYELQPRKAE